MKYKLSNIQILCYSIILFFALPLKAQVNIGSKDAPHSFSLLELTTTDYKGGLRLPQLTTAQCTALIGDLLSDPAAASGLVVYNTDINCIEYWHEGQWVTLCNDKPDITFTDAAGKSFVFDPETPFPATETILTLTLHESPECTPPPTPSYSVSVKVGNGVLVTQQPDGTGMFKITVPANASGLRFAVISVTDNCMNESQDFIFAQLAPFTQADPAAVTICSGSTTMFNLEAATGGSGVITYQWQQSSDNTIWANVTGGTGATAAAYTTPALTSSMYYRRQATAAISGETITSTAAKVTVTANNTAAAPSSTPTLCINTALSPNITIATTGATGIGNPTGLPGGVTAAWANNVITISGTPTAGGTFSYTIPLTGGCGTANATGTITVNANRTAGTPSSTPTLCINTALSPNITIATTGATGIGAPTGLPGGVTAAWASNVITISGTPTAGGTFNYTIPLTGGCGTVNATGTITVTANNTAAAPSSTPTLCISTALSPNITIATTGATGIGAPTGLPGGVTAAWASNVITISGTPTADGTFNYTIPLTGGCGTVNATGTITVTADFTQPNPAAVAICNNTTTKFDVAAATGGSGTITYQWQQSSDNINWTNVTGGTGATAAAYTTPALTANTYYRRQATAATCGGTISSNSALVTINPAATIALASGTRTQTVCSGVSITLTTYLFGGSATTASVTNLPAGLNQDVNTATKIVTITGTPTASGTYTIKTDGCSPASITGAVTVNAATITLTRGTQNPTVCSGIPMDTTIYTFGGIATGATVANLPAGLNQNVNTTAKTVTISGIPTASGTYTITTSGGSCPPAATITGTVTVNPAFLGDISGSSCTITPGATLTYSVPKAPDGTTYDWTVSAPGWSIKGGQYTNSITVEAGSIGSSGTIIVTANNGSCSSIKNVSVGNSVKTPSGWLTFMCANLGASSDVQAMSPIEQATKIAPIPNPSVSGTIDSTVYGNLYQWGRRPDGHQLRNSGRVQGPISTLDENGQVTGSANIGNFIINNTKPYDWRSPSDDTKTLWYNNGKTVNDPCPTGWRVPTIAEWQSINGVNVNRWSWTQTANGTAGYLITPLDGSYSAKLFLPAAGYRNYDTSNGVDIGNASSNGSYSSSTSMPTDTPNQCNILTFTSGRISTDVTSYTGRALGCSVRCVAE